jgi:histidine ammonia-lyase
MLRSHRALTERVAEGSGVYGASSGVGDLRTEAVDDAQLGDLQANIVRSHSCGIGEPLDPITVRGAMASRAATFARGWSAVRPELAELLAEMVNRGVEPVVPCRGSVGASGDPVLLAHIGEVVIGEGRARLGDRLLPGGTALRSAGLEPLALRPREGLALVNGLDFTLSAAVLQASVARRVADWADGIAAVSLEVLRAASEPFSERVQDLRGAGGHREVAARIRALHAGSSQVGGRDPPQDPYCLRCVPQVHGATADVLLHAEETLDAELAATIDNPLISPDDGAVFHAGLFHGQRIAMAFDYLALALVNLANIAQTRIALLLSGQRGLPRVLARNPGVESGLMMLETTSASVVARARAAAAPLSVHSIGVSAEQEDHVSMSWEAVRRTGEIAELVAGVLAAEGVAAAAAAEVVSAHSLGAGTQRVAARLAGAVSPRHGDAATAADLARLSMLILTSPCDVPA